MTPAAKIALLPIRLYQWCISPWLGACCRFHPTCSHYAAEAMDKHGVAKGFMLSLQRLLRCHPFGAHGYDPVPPPKTSPLD